MTLDDVIQHADDVAQVVPNTTKHGLHIGYRFKITI